MEDHLCSRRRGRFQNKLASMVVVEDDRDDSQRRRRSLRRKPALTSDENANTTKAIMHSDDEAEPATKRRRVTRLQKQQQKNPLPLSLEPFSFPPNLSIATKKNKNKKNSYFHDLSHRPLTETEQCLWSQPCAAKYAAAHYYAPGHAIRRLGVITRILKLNNDNNKNNLLELLQASSVAQGQRSAKSNQNKKEKEKEHRSVVVNLKTVPSDHWKDALKGGFLTPGWDVHGELLIDETTQQQQHQETISCTCKQLLKMLTWKKHLIDTHKGETKSYYNNGLQKVPVDTVSVLRSLLDLASPDSGLYGMPLVTARAVLRQLAPQQYRLEIGVYANRLLFEVMTQELSVVMSALDHGSYIVTQPLSLPPSPPADEPSAFCSDKDQVVTFDDDEEFRIDPDTTVEGEETVDSAEDVDATLLKESTRDHTNKLNAFSNEGFLKLIENTGVNTSNWPDLQERIRCRLRVQLLPHQIHGLCWMHQMEQLPGASFGLNSILWQERAFQDGGTYFYSPALGQVRLTLGGGSGSGSGSGKQTKPRVVKGGILADMMGMGKTVQVLALILASMEELKEEAATKPSDSNHKHATLIVVPPALVSQWFSEIAKVTGDSLVYDFFDNKKATFERKSARQDGPADIVVTTYNAFEKTGGRGPNPSTKVLTACSWGRVVLDEMQNIRSSTTVVAKNCEGLECERRWMLSGTPLFDGIEDFRGELCFLGLEPFAANNEDGFFDFAITKHWEKRSRYGLDTLRVLSQVMLRRSKSMTIRANGRSLLSLEPMTITFEPVPQDPAERALYCYIEYLLHAAADDNSADDKLTKKVTKQNRLFLRLLREICASPALLSGGLGCKSQLQALNHIMTTHNRQTTPAASDDSSAALSCDEAVRYLSQVQDIARVDDNFETTLTLGNGAGISRRDRAARDSPEQLLKVVKDRLDRATKVSAAARSKWAKALWHRALEGVTTGALEGVYYETTKISIRKLWKWRWSIACSSSDKSQLPSALTRGWRPSPSFFGSADNHDFDKATFLTSLYNQHPRFTWAHPYSLLVSQIPTIVTKEELAETFSSCSVAPPRVVRLVGNPEKKEPSVSWTATVQFETEIDFVRAFSEAKSKTTGGIKVQCSNRPPWIENEILAAKATLDEAEADHRVHPCPLNEKKEKIARQIFDNASIGLRVLSKETHRPGHVLCARPFDLALRGALPRSAKALRDSTERALNDALATLAANKPIIDQEAVEVERLSGQLATGFSQSVNSLNTFTTLEELRDGNCQEDCTICFGPLGQGMDSGGIVALTRCGHLACFGCLDRWVQQKEGNGQSPVCDKCRKPISKKNVKKVDPKKTADQEELDERRKIAKSLVMQASEMLETSNGQLDARLWEALYLAMDLPADFDGSLHGTYTAIPGHFLAHLRHTTGLSLHCNRQHPQDQPEPKLSSKMRALLSDLPDDELSVVFASSNAVVKHILAVLEIKGIKCRGLYTGQTEVDSERAVSEWKDPKNSSCVLVVQAGVAACGLTLTDASKMFLLEPFLKYEEEQQAYARLHRYGQLNAVECKVYYTPVSVEARLLEWRKQASGASDTSATEEKTVYAPLRGVEDMEQEDDEDHMEQNQTCFLLGLESGTQETDGTTDTDE